MLDLTYIIPDMKTNTDNRTEERKNRFTGESFMLTPEEANKHDAIFLAEIEEKYDIMQKGLDKFSRLNPKAYMTLLD